MALKVGTKSFEHLNYVTVKGSNNKIDSFSLCSCLHGKSSHAMHRDKLFEECRGIGAKYWQELPIAPLDFFFLDYWIFFFCLFSSDCWPGTFLSGEMTNGCCIKFANSGNSTVKFCFRVPITFQKNFWRKIKPTDSF